MNQYDDIGKIFVEAATAFRTFEEKEDAGIFLAQILGDPYHPARARVEDAESRKTRPQELVSIAQGEMNALGAARRGVGLVEYYYLRRMPVIG